MLCCCMSDSMNHLLNLFVLFSRSQEKLILHTHILEHPCNQKVYKIHEQMCQLCHNRRGYYHSACHALYHQKCFS